MQLQSPKNEWSLVVRFLMDYHATGLSMKEACKEYFTKFQSRLGELERSFDSSGKPRSLSLKIRRLRMNKVNRFGKTMTFLNYKSLASKTYLKNLMGSLNKNGLNHAKK